VSERKCLAPEHHRAECECATVSGQRESGLLAEVRRLTDERDKLQRFKSYVHARLDAAGVPADPESAHKAEGCRIGGRLDAVFAERDALRAALEACELVMDTAAFEGVGEILAPAYRESWKAAHMEAQRLLAKGVQS
jgi:hypothetical protein